MAVREETPTAEIPEVLFEASKSPWTGRTETENLLPNLSGLGAHPMRLRKKVRIEEADKVSKAVVIPVVRRRCKKQKMVGIYCQALGQLVALGLLGLVTASRCA